jgi:antitoxin component of MazEF toxin-antitoxin module
MLQKVLKIGNSLGVTLPREFVVKNKIRDGIEISVVHSNGTITFSPKIPKNTNYKTVSDKEFFKLAREVDKKYTNALDELSKLP